MASRPRPWPLFTELNCPLLPEYPHLAEIRLGDAVPILETTSRADPDEEQTMRDGAHAVLQAIQKDLSLAFRLPPVLAKMLLAGPGVPSNVRRALLGASA